MMSVEGDDKRTRTRSKGIRVPIELVGGELSILGCPIARKRRLEEAEQEQDAELPPPKRRSNPLKLALDEGFSAESDGSSEGEGEKDGERRAETKEVESVCSWRLILEQRHLHPRRSSLPLREQRKWPTHSSTSAKSPPTMNPPWTFSSLLPWRLRRMSPWQ
nr:myelin transcription factor 1-like [Pseudochaenichthys georgianus]